jgi:hypothetical protein
MCCVTHRVCDIVGFFVDVAKTSHLRVLAPSSGALPPYRDPTGRFMAPMCARSAGQWVGCG